MSLYKQNKTSADLETKGVIFEYSLDDNGKPINFRIARAGGANTKYSTVLAKLVKPYRRQLQTETVSPDTIQRIMREVYAETIVLGWENVRDENGNEMEFTKENVIKLFTDLPDVFETIQEFANGNSAFLESNLELAAKN